MRALRIGETTNQLKYWFLRRGENLNTQGKSLGAEKRSNKLNPHMMQSLGMEPGPYCWEARALTLAPTFQWRVDTSCSDKTT